jgi:hypothetical protein
MRIHTFTEAGGHPHNEDAFRVQPHPLDPGVLLVALADGQGGRAGGARAAQIAVDTAIDRLKQSHPSGFFDLNGAVFDADAAVAADPKAGFTTLIAFVVLPSGRVRAESCGDSALCLVGAEGVRVLTERQFKNPPVGSGDAIFTTCDCVIEEPWQLVAMTDGVWKYAGWPAVKLLAGELRGEELIEALASRARLPGSGTFPDDFTAVVISSDVT